MSEFRGDDGLSEPRCEKYGDTGGSCAEGRVEFEADVSNVGLAIEVTLSESAVTKPAEVGVRRPRDPYLEVEVKAPLRSAKAEANPFFCDLLLELLPAYGRGICILAICDGSFRPSRRSALVILLLVVEVAVE